MEDLLFDDASCDDNMMPCSVAAADDDDDAAVRVSDFGRRNDVLDVWDWLRFRHLTI